MACFYSFGRGHEIQKTLDLVRVSPEQWSYLKGTYYYPSPDCCLYFIARLLHSFTDSELQEALGSLLRSRVRERFGENGYALDLATRIVTCKSLGIDCELDEQALLDLQQEDGGWEPGVIYVYGTTRITIGNSGVTTAIAIQGLTHKYRSQSEGSM